MFSSGHHSALGKDVCRKALSRTELRYNFIIVKSQKDIFPKPEMPFILESQGKRFQARIDSQYRLRRESGSFVDLDVIFQVGDIAVIRKKAEGIYTLNREPRAKTQSL